MSLAWWNLPGARRFIEQAADDIRDGKNLILCLPRFAPDYFQRALSETIGQADDWLTLSLEYFAPDENSPLDFLYSKYLPDEPAGAVRSLERLLENLTGRIIWLTDVSASNWSDWSDFLTEYQHACQNVSLYARTVFVVSLIGDLCSAAPVENVCLVRREWRGTLDELDALLYAAALCRRNLSPVKRRLAIALSANLGAWDLPLIERLTEENLENLLEPEAMLKSLASERGWHQDTPNIWENGTLDFFDDIAQPHSAFIALNNGQQGLSRRIWSAQATVLLPFVEERRQNLLFKLNDVLPRLLSQYPVVTRFNETITDVHELEIGHIESLLGKETSISLEMRIEVENLRRMRNKLSHLQSVSIQLLSSF